MRDQYGIYVFDPFLLEYWFWAYGHGDYRGRPDNLGNPSVWSYNQVSDEGYGAVATWFGVPVRLAKASGFIFNYTLQKLGCTADVWYWIANQRGHTDDAVADGLAVAGRAIAEGAAYEITVRQVLEDTFSLADQKVQKLWPNTSPCDNHRQPDPSGNDNWDRYFVSPSFLDYI